MCKEIWNIRYIYICSKFTGNQTKILTKIVNNSSYFYKREILTLLDLTLLRLIWRYYNIYFKNLPNIRFFLSWHHLITYQMPFLWMKLVAKGVGNTWRCYCFYGLCDHYSQENQTNNKWWSRMFHNVSFKARFWREMDQHVDAMKCSPAQI